MKPDTPPITNTTTKPAKNRKAVVKTGRPVQIVASQANTATALGMAMMIDAALKNDSARGGRPVANMWCSQTPKPSTIVAPCQRHGGVADQRPAAEDRQRLGDDAHGRQHDRVDPGMAEHPEQVLPQQRLAAAGGVEEMRAELPVHPQHEEGQAHARAPRAGCRPRPSACPRS